MCIIEAVNQSAHTALEIVYVSAVLNPDQTEREGIPSPGLG